MNLSMNFDMEECIVTAMLDQGRKLSAGIYWKNPAGGNSGGYKNTPAETATKEL